MMDGAYPPGVTGSMIPEGVNPVFIPLPCCRYCTEYNGDSCMKEWNNADEDYYFPERDDREPEESCDDYEWNGELLEEPHRPIRDDYAGEKLYQEAMRKYNEFVREERGRREK